MLVCVSVGIEGVEVGVETAVWVKVGVAIPVGVKLGVDVGVAVEVKVMEAVGVAVKVRVAVATGELVCVSVGIDDPGVGVETLVYMVLVLFEGSVSLPWLPSSLIVAVLKIGAIPAVNGEFTCTVNCTLLLAW